MGVLLVHANWANRLVHFDMNAVLNSISEMSNNIDAAFTSDGKSTTTMLKTFLTSIKSPLKALFICKNFFVKFERVN